MASPDKTPLEIRMHNQRVAYGAHVLAGVSVAEVEELLAVVVRLQQDVAALANYCHESEGRVVRLREALELCNGEDLRLNGCACKPGSPCYLHGQIVAPLLVVSPDKPPEPDGLDGKGALNTWDWPADKPLEPNAAEAPCTRCGATPETGQTPGCGECEGILEPLCPKCGFEPDPTRHYCDVCAAVGGEQE